MFRGAVAPAARRGRPRGALRGGGYTYVSAAVRHFIRPHAKPLSLAAFCLTIEAPQLAQLA
jgi:hypothetical protein